MQVFLAFGHPTVRAATELFDWFEELDGSLQGHTCLLLTDSTMSGQEAAPVILRAEKLFSKVDVIRPKHAYSKEWPHVQNAMFKMACKWNAAIGKKPFFWLETDAIPLVKGSIQQLERAYLETKARLMGVVYPRPWPHVNAIAVWPADTMTAIRDVMAANDTAFDNYVRPNMVRGFVQTNLIQHEWNPPRFFGEDSLKRINEGAVIYHQNKDGTLIKALRARLNGATAAPVAPPQPPQPPQPEPQIQVAEQEVYEPEPEQPKLTVVITTHKRPHKARRALDSCLVAGIDEVVMTVTGATKNTREIFELWANDKHKVIINDHRTKSNDAWINGIKDATNEWVLILHDDDLVLPHFLPEVTQHLGETPFLYFPAKFHRTEGDAPPDILEGPFHEKGNQPTGDLKKAISVKGTRTITPVRGVFRRDDLIDWLEEAGKKLPQECYYRSDFLVGNDLWIWLRACDAYSRFRSLEKPLVSLGCDMDSTTTKDISLKNQRLPGIYDVTRAIYAKRAGKKKAPLEPAAPAPKASQPPPKIEVKPDHNLHIISIVLDAAPFLLTQLQTFNRLKCNWHWYIMEGVAEAIKDTAWCKTIPPRRSMDGTIQLLQDFEFHQRITVASSERWAGKVEMVNHPLTRPDLKAGVVMQIDMDEFWLPDQIETIVNLLATNQDRSHAMFWCRYFFGPANVQLDRNCYANNPNQEWRRAWNWNPGQLFATHEPPVMSGDQSKFFSHEETEQLGLVFDHYGYVLQRQAAFKQLYYGYHDAPQQWRRLQVRKQNPVKLSDYLTWVPSDHSPQIHWVS